MENIYVEKLKQEKEIYPEKYDGSYELVTETVKQYQTISLENINYADIDLIYFMTVGSWAFGMEKRKELIQKTSLDQPKKEYLTMLIDQVMEKAKNREYIHDEFPDKVTVGMFGAGFGTFSSGSCDLDTAKEFISLMVAISKMTEEDEILDYLEEELKKEYKGIGIASFSQVLHCLKPYIFPIVNGNMGKGTTVYFKLGIKLDKNITPKNYIANIRKIRDFRNNNFTWKNYRIMDLLTREIEKNKILENINYKKLDEIIEKYKVEFSKFSTDELYKWKAIKVFQDNWDIDAEDFSEMLKKALSASENLLMAAMYFPKSMIISFAEKEPETTREMFRTLFNEDEELEKRINLFIKQSEKILLRYWSQGKNHYQDLHTISTYLCFRYPEKYYMYKVSVNKRAAELLNVKISNSNKIQELFNFFALCDKILEYIKENKELITLSQNSLTDEHYKDPEYHALVFDLMFFAGIRYREPKVWLYAPGENASIWDECLANGAMYLGWDDVGDLTKNNSKTYVKNKLKEVYDKDKDYMNDGLALYQFANDMEDGDIVYVKKGMSKIIGKGIVNSDYIYDNTRKKYKHIREVIWEIYDIEEEYLYKKLPQKTLTEITNDLEYCSNLQKLVQGEKNMNIDIKKVSVIDGEYICDIAISKDEWKELLLDEQIFNTYRKDVVLKWYKENNKRATCKEMSDKYGNGANYYNNAIWQLARAVNKKINRFKIIGADGEPSFWIVVMKGRYKNQNFEWELREEIVQAIDELIQEGKISIDENLNSVLISKQKYYWLNANPKIWSFSELAIGESIEYEAINENGNKRRIYKNYEEIQPGDLVIGYESSPVKCIVALGKVEKKLGNNNVMVKKVESLLNPIPYNEIIEIDELSNMEILKNSQGSLFKLEENEYNIILDIIRESNPRQSQKEEEKYTETNFLNDVYISKKEYQDIVNVIDRKKNIILQGAPGVGKTFMAKRLAYSMMGKKDTEKIMSIQFHQSYSYEDFIEGYRPIENGFKLEKGSFYNFCKKAENDPNNKYFCIIDEINRGNLSKIFGELLVLIENDKREKDKVVLAYSKEKFSVPKNLYIIGMMNTADRSLAMIDYALRRRFSFYDVNPAFDNEQFKKYQKDLNNTYFNEVIEKIKNLNKEIEEDSSLGSGFKIGHSYFCEIINADENEIKSILKYEIVPMIKEYWFDNQAKIDEWTKTLIGE